MSAVIYEKRGSVAWITLNRPEVLNAINLQMRDELWEVWQAARDDPDIRVLIMKGAGERAFSAGADITEFGTAPSYVAAREARHARDLWPLLLHLEKPTIAAIHGYALGGGLELSLYCDFRFAAEDARFGLPEVGLGYIPSAGGTQMLPRLISPGIALELVLSGDMIDAHEALRIGLVHWVVPRADLYSEAERFAAQLVSRPAAALAYAKEAVNRGLDLRLQEGLAAEARLAELALASPEAVKRLRTLRERRGEAG